MSDTQFELRSGRKLGISGYGDPKSRRLVLLCTPPPASGAFNPDPLVTNQHDVHVIVVDRPGYGGSEPLDDAQTPSVTTSADDVAEYLSQVHLIAAALKSGPARTVGVVGWGWGGATALSLAARNPSLVDRLVVAGTPKPSRSRRGEPAPSPAEFARPRFISSISTAAGSLPMDDASDLDALGVRDDDPALTVFGVRNRLGNLFDEGNADHSLGLAADRLAARDTRWADELGQVTADSLLIYGAMDPVASAADGNWYRRHVPRSQLVAPPWCGRLAIVSLWDRILRHVAPGGEKLRP